MKAFTIDPNIGSDYSANGVWSPDQTQASGYKVGSWKQPQSTLVFDEDGRLAAGQSERFKRDWLVVPIEELHEMDTIGIFYPIRSVIPAVKDALRIALEDAAPGTIEFIEIHRLWAEHHNCPLPGGPYYLANLFARRDCWDDTVTEIRRTHRRDGTSYEYVSGKMANRAVRASALEGATIWRETRTNDVHCTEHVKAALRAAGCRGWSFRQIRVTDR